MVCWRSWLIAGSWGPFLRSQCASFLHVPSQSRDGSHLQVCSLGPSSEIPVVPKSVQQEHTNAKSPTGKVAGRSLQCCGESFVT